MGRQPGFFDVDARLRELSAKGDDLERISGLIDFEIFRPELERAVPRSDIAEPNRNPTSPRAAGRERDRCTTARSTSRSRRSGMTASGSVSATNSTAFAPKGHCMTWEEVERWLDVHASLHYPDSDYA